MSLKTQSKVLRTLDEQRFTPVGGDDAITVDVRVIASTNKDLEEEISKGQLQRRPFLPAECDSLLRCRLCASGRKTFRCSRDTS